MIHKNFFQEFIYLILPSPENQNTFSSEKGPVRKSPRQVQDRTVAFESVVRFGWGTNHAHESGQNNMIAKCIDLTNDGICSRSSHACSRFDEAIVASDFQHNNTTGFGVCWQARAPELSDLSQSFPNELSLGKFVTSIHTWCALPKRSHCSLGCTLDFFAVWPPRSTWFIERQQLAHVRIDSMVCVTSNIQGSTIPVLLKCRVRVSRSTHLVSCLRSCLWC